MRRHEHHRRHAQTTRQMVRRGIDPDHQVKRTHQPSALVVVLRFDRPRKVPYRQSRRLDLFGRVLVLERHKVRVKRLYDAPERL